MNAQPSTCDRVAKGDEAARLPAVRRPFARELLVVGLLFAWGVWWSAAYQRAALAAGIKGAFYQSYFEPSVLLACGRGFALVAPGHPLPALTAFLETRVDSFDCAALPNPTPTTTIGVFYSWWYLMLAVALVWKLFGVAWSSLIVLLSVLFGTVIVLAYGLFRLGVGRLLSTAAALALSVSTLHLTNLPNLRDYAKAPFVLALILLLGWLVTGTASARRVLIISGIYGIVLGVGYGFRSDLLVNIPPFFVTLFGFLQGGLGRIRLKIAAASLCVLAFAASAWPIVRYIRVHGSCQWHIVFLGLTTQFDPPLGIVPAAYDWGHNYADSYVYSSLGGFPWRGGDGSKGPLYCGPEYDAITAGYVFRLARTFPADLVTRAYASVLRISNLPFDDRTAPLETYRGRFYDRRGRILERLRHAGPLLALIAGAVIAAADLRIGLWVLFMLLFFGGYPMLQFQPRHHFHLEWVGWFAGALLTSAALRSARAIVFRLTGRSDANATGTELRDRGAVVARRLLIWGLVAIGAIVGPVWFLRYYQHHRVRALIQAVIAETSETVATVTVPHQGGILIEPSAPTLLASDRRGPFWGEFLRIETDPAACGSPPAVTLRYDPRDPDNNFTRTMSLDAAASNVTVLAPVFRRFVGVEVASDAPGCVLAVYHPKYVAAIPVWLFAVLPHDLTRVRLFQSIEPSLVDVLAWQK